MIPNSAPMCAVFLKTGIQTTFSRPIAGWSLDLDPLVPDDTGLINLGIRNIPGAAFLGIWPHGWSASADEVASFLPDHVPGTPHPLAVHVTVREIPTGWIAYRTDTGMTIDEDASYERLDLRLAVKLGTVHIDAIIPMERDD